MSDYIRKQFTNKNIDQWNVCIVSNTDETVFINRYENNPGDSRKPQDDLITYDLDFNGEKITLGCSVRNQRKEGRSSEYFLIAKNQIDDLKDRQVDLQIDDNKTNEKIKAQRAAEKKGLLLIYALDPRGTAILDSPTPIIGYSLHFPKIENEVKTSYTTTIYDSFDDEMQEDDDSPNDDNV